MNKLTLIPRITTVTLCCLMHAFAVAQDDAIDDLIIVEEEEKITTESGASAGGGIGKNFSGSVVGSYAGLLSDTTRSYIGASLRYANTWEEQGLSLVIEGKAYKSDASIEFDRVTDRGGVITQEDITREIDVSSLYLQEAYLRFSRDFIDVYVGRRIITLGQFDAFSPVDFILPIDISDGEVSLPSLTEGIRKPPPACIYTHIQNWNCNYITFLKLKEILLPKICWKNRLSTLTPTTWSAQPRFNIPPMKISILRAWFTPGKVSLLV